MGLPLNNMLAATAVFTSTLVWAAASATSASTCMGCDFDDISLVGDTYIIVGKFASSCTTLFSENGKEWRSIGNKTENRMQTPYFLLRFDGGAYGYTTTGHALKFVSGRGWVEVPEMDYSLRNDEIVYSVAVVDGGINLTTQYKMYRRDKSSRWTEMLESKDGLGLFFYSNTLLNNALYVESGGEVFRSVDGIEWKEINELYDTSHIIWDGLRYLAAGEYGIKESHDGIKWRLLVETINTNKKDEYLYGLAWGGGNYVGIGTLGNIYYSDNANAWHKSDYQTELKITQIKYGSAGYVLIGYEPVKGSGGVVSYSTGEYGASIIHSKDGVRWLTIMNDAVNCE